MINMIKTNVIVKLQVDGTHNWPNAKNVFPEVSFLSDIHRHVFHITASLRVTHSDRDREFIMLKRDIQDFLKQKFYDDKERTHVFNSMSCEMIAECILEYFGCDWVEVFEDNENGARVEML